MKDTSYTDSSSKFLILLILYIEQYLLFSVINNFLDSNVYTPFFIRTKFVRPLRLRVTETQKGFKNDARRKVQGSRLCCEQVTFASTILQMKRNI